MPGTSVVKASTTSRKGSTASLILLAIGSKKSSSAEAMSRRMFSMLMCGKATEASPRRQSQSSTKSPINLGKPVTDNSKPSLMSALTPKATVRAFCGEATMLSSVRRPASLPCKSISNSPKMLLPWKPLAASVSLSTTAALKNSKEPEPANGVTSGVLGLPSKKALMTTLNSASAGSVLVPRKKPLADEMPKPKS